ncbi:MAG: hypothetical protein E6Q50_14025 [Lysobacter sp.]|nr:MAG: hypothetical protein E6Q50_14025 [Lysobacter sp.]
MVKEQCELLLKDDHVMHEDIVRFLQQEKDPYAISYLRQAVLLKPHLEYLAYDDYGSFYKKCFWALRSIDTPEAIAVIQEFSNSDDPVIRKEASYRLARIRGDAV